MIYLDSHVVVWLYAGLTDKLSNLAKDLLNEHELFISPIVRLELQYLYEIGRITEKSDLIISDLFDRVELRLCSKDFNTIISQSLSITSSRQVCVYCKIEEECRRQKKCHRKKLEE